MNRPSRTSRQQRGAVAIIVAIVIGLLILMIGLVVDLGYLYTRKTELQNAADAAALAGAKELNGTTAGITAAASQAIALAALNAVDFSGNPVVIGNNQITFGPTPDGPWDAVAASESAPTNKRFIKVDTTGIALSTVETWFMRVMQWGFGGIESTSTFGRAVAGPNIVDITPIAACVLDSDDCPPNGTGNCGYRKGQSYKLSVLGRNGGPIGPGTTYWINPDTTEEGECSGSGSTAYTLPFICQGKVPANIAAATTVLTNSGVSVPQLRALDSRFDVYDVSAKCDPATAPPDTNIKEYMFDDANTAGWMSPTPVTYISSIHGDLCQAHPNKGDCQAARVSDYVTGEDINADSGGVVWAFSDSDVSNTPGRAPTGTYPSSGTPYSQTSGNFFEPVTSGHTAVPGRRILTMLMVQCPTTGGNCKPAPVKARARFGLQRMVGNGSDQDIYLEFIETVNVTGITAQYKLYR